VWNYYLCGLVRAHPEEGHKNDPRDGTPLLQGQAESWGCSAWRREGSCRSSGRIELWATWSCCRCPCSLQESWTRWPLRIFYDSKYSTVLSLFLENGTGFIFPKNCWNSDFSQVCDRKMSSKLSSLKYQSSDENIEQSHASVSAKWTFISFCYPLLQMSFTWYSSQQRNTLTLSITLADYADSSWS